MLPGKASDLELTEFEDKMGYSVVVAYDNLGANCNVQNTSLA